MKPKNILDHYTDFPDPRECLYIANKVVVVDRLPFSVVRVVATTVHGYSSSISFFDNPVITDISSLE